MDTTLDVAVGADVDSLPTPTLLLDRPKLVANAARMRARAKALGVRLRPHMKTAKSIEVGKIALGGEFDAIAVSTLREAEYFLAAGIRDILYAVGIVPSKLDQAAALMAKGADLKIAADSLPVARASAAHGAPFQVMIEIDTGDARGGVAPSSPALIDIARAISSGGRARVAGVFTHAGQSYDRRDPSAIAAIAEEERAGLVAAAARLRDAGFECETISVGSSPTAVHARHLTGVTEMRPGVYMLGDLYQAGIGTCRVEDIALSVLASVISHRPADNVLLIDAGALALSKDRSTEKLDEGDCGFGLVCDAATGAPIAGLRVAAVSQEHGKVTAPTPLPFERLSIGSRVRVLPNHACITAAGHDGYWVLDGGIEVVARFGRCNGW